MPVRPLAACSTPGCPGQATHRGKCERHALLRERQRGSAARRGYDPDWRSARAAYLIEHPYCVVCNDGTPATDVDHIVPHRGDKELFWDQSNWQALCHRHHSAKTMRESVRG